MDTKIAITDDHIKRARQMIQPGSPEDLRLYHCPVALACQDAGLEHVYVTSNIVRWWENRVSKFARLPAEGRDFVARFDRGEPVEPICLTLIPIGGTE